MNGGGFVSREHLINKLRELGYKFKRDCWRVSMYKRGTHRVEVRKRDFLDEDAVRSMLRQCGQSPEEIDAFIKCTRS